MPRLTLGDRLSAAAVGLFFGAIVGFALAWIAGVYSNRLGASEISVNFKHWVGYCALGFGAVGLAFGPFVGSFLGSVISGVFQFEQVEHSNPEIPTWLVVVLLGCVVAGVWSFA
jgi:LytS/YehU family sensor histidine kinase